MLIMALLSNGERTLNLKEGRRLIIHQMCFVKAW